MRILLIEDDPKLGRLIVQFLQRHHHQVDHATTGHQGIDLLLNHMYDVAIIDWMLPDRDGPDICAIARAASIPTGLLMLTARSQVEDIVTGLRRGADDYLRKPFDVGELLARIEALARRHLGSYDHDTLRSHGVEINRRAHQVVVANEPIALTSTEFDLLELLIRHSGQALSRDQILRAVWRDESDVLATAVDVYISYLRRKLHPHADSCIETVRGIGYRWKADVTR
jgi:DNA-binding response OmpR family regulator